MDQFNLSNIPSMQSEEHDDLQDEMSTAKSRSLRKYELQCKLSLFVMSTRRLSTLIFTMLIVSV